jgi:hypothetical protein
MSVQSHGAACQGSQQLDRRDLGYTPTNFLGQVLAQQAIGVLTGTALPRTMRVAEVDAYAGVNSQFGMAGYFLALVIGQALASRRTDGIESSCETCQRRSRSGIFHARQQHQTAGSLNEHANRGQVAGILDEVTFLLVRHEFVRGEAPDGSRYLLRRVFSAQHGGNDISARTSIAGRLAGNRRWRSFQSTGTSSHTEAALSPGGDGNSVLKLKLSISGWYCMGTP